ncbi:uncharacterized protein LOC116846760 [Odontomachus brunneus]|uniref:uncharacterized protein LOC116846760 n=1 Tax=Odontomachus brunneus TaxID=486640 RepID=UPI0013F1A592|nr:uncharacterized protein LOC116846760 [Odontomachus brunneus]
MRIIYDAEGQRRRATSKDDAEGPDYDTRLRYRSTMIVYVAVLRFVSDLVELVAVTKRSVIQVFADAGPKDSVRAKQSRFEELKAADSELATCFDLGRELLMTEIGTHRKGGCSEWRCGWRTGGSGSGREGSARRSCSRTLPALASVLRSNRVYIITRLWGMPRRRIRLGPV